MAMSGLTPRATAILTELKSLASLPLGGTRAMPPELYSSPEIHQLELERIFAKEWVCPGLAVEIPNPGDYTTFAIGAQPIFSVRGRDGRIRSFSNVCRHRMMILLKGHGNAQRVVCPYHAWTYELDGRLLAAPQMQQTESFRKGNLCLPEVRTEIWNGWIYVTLNADAPSVAEKLEPLRSLVERYGMEDYRPIITQEFRWKTNWKLVNENFMEGYHGPYAHKSTAGQGFKVEDTEFGVEAHDAFTYHTFVRDETANYGRAHPGNTRLEGRWRSTSVLPTVYPTHMYSLAPDYLWYLSVQPDGPGDVLVRLGVAIPPEVHAAAGKAREFRESMKRFFNAVNAEDQALVEAIYRGSQAPLAAGGPLSWLERALHDFKGYLARRLAGDLAA
jgi:phenylpropionate dioxygenase-like ring-hydroxylating dioxygenase large terminal subunit